MGFWIHIRVHPQGHRCLFPLLLRFCVNGDEFIPGFNIEHEYPGIEGAADLVYPLANTGKNDPVCRDAGTQGSE